MARVNTLSVMRSFVLGGVGAAVLATRFADAWGLVRLGDPIEGFDMALWALTHADLRDTARVRAFLDTYGPKMKGFARREASKYLPR